MGKKLKLSYRTSFTQAIEVSYFAVHEFFLLSYPFEKQKSHSTLCPSNQYQITFLNKNNSIFRERAQTSVMLEIRIVYSSIFLVFHFNIHEISLVYQINTRKTILDCILNMIDLLCVV